MSENNITMNIEKLESTDANKELIIVSDAIKKIVDEEAKKILDEEAKNESKKTDTGVWSHQYKGTGNDCSFCINPLKDAGCACMLCNKPPTLCRLCFVAHMGFHHYMGNESLGSDVLSPDDRNFFKEHENKAMQMQNKTDLF
jgi:hypothetical protein